MPTKPQTFSLPWPPSVNHYYLHVRGRVIISTQGRAYRDEVAWLLRAAGAYNVNGDIALYVEFCPPDKRRRDLDNVQKALWDALEHGGLFQNDSQIKDFHAVMCAPCKGGRVVIQISETERKRTA